MPLHAILATQEHIVLGLQQRVRRPVLIVKQASTRRVTVPQSASLAPLGSSTLIQEHHARMPAQTVGLEPTQMPLLLLVQSVALENTAQTLQQ